MTDIEITKKFKMKEISELCDNLNIKNYDMFGKYKAKINRIDANKDGKVILVTAINPTPYGEGKTTVAIGLHDSMRKLGYDSMLVLREPSMGPVFGVKGGATGGGYSQIVPMEDINLHFTGDFHAITSANNLISACIDNSIYFGNPLRIKKVLFERCLDVNDRSLRNVNVGYDTKFNITAASEVMAIFCLAKDLDDLRQRLDDIIIGIDEDDNEVYLKELNITGSLIVLLKEAFKPNLVQTLYNNPVIVHGGPFANIAHGCNSVVATNMAKKISDYVILEAGFGSDAGAVKFFDIKCRDNNINPYCVLLVATIRALKYNGNNSLKDGLCNLGVHIENLSKFNQNVIVVLNKFPDDSIDDINIVREYVNTFNIPFTVSTAYIDGENGASEVVKEVIKCKEKELNLLYKINDTLEDKIDVMCKSICRCNKIEYSEIAKEKIKRYSNIEYPICIAKTQYSISDDAKKLGAPSNYTLTVRDIKVNNGAKFITVYLGNILTMPGLSKHPNACNIDLVNDEIVGIF